VKRKTDIEAQASSNAVEGVSHGCCAVAVAGCPLQLQLHLSHGAILAELILHLLCCDGVAQALDMYLPSQKQLLWQVAKESGTARHA
jgi:hypothetical protein